MFHKRCTSLMRFWCLFLSKKTPQKRECTHCGGHGQHNEYSPALWCWSNFWCISGDKQTHKIEVVYSVCDTPSCNYWFWTEAFCFPAFGYFLIMVCATNSCNRDLTNENVFNILQDLENALFFGIIILSKSI